MNMSSHIITPGPYRATKLWNEVTRLFRAGMPLRKHRQNLRPYSCCFTASAAVDWLHQLLCNNSNFGPDVTRQQTVQLLKKFLKNHVIEDVKGRWGTEDLEDNSVLYRFPSTSPLKKIPCPPAAAASNSIKKRPSFRDRESFFKFKSLTKNEKEPGDNMDPSAPSEGETQPADQPVQKRPLTEEDEQEIWRSITLTHLQKILGVASLDEVLDRQCVNPQNIIHNMTKVGKHGVVMLDDKTNDLPHWVLNAMKSLANWPKYDSDQPTYPGFERDVFKTVSDHFYSLQQPLLTYDLYELFINILVFCGYVTTHQRGKRKKADLPSAPPPAKASFLSTECLLLSLLRQGACDEAESPMREVLGGTLQSRSAALKGGGTSAGLDHLGGSCASLSTAGSLRLQTRSCSLETILDDSSLQSRQKLFSSSDSLASCGDSCGLSSSRSVHLNANRNRLSVVSVEGPSVTKRPRPLRPRSVGSCLDIVVETREEAEKEPKRQGPSSRCLSVSPLDPHYSSNSTSTTSRHPLPANKSGGPASSPGAAGPRPAVSTSNLQILSAPAVVRRCLSSFDISKRPQPDSLHRTSVCLPKASAEHSLLQPQSECVAIEALQICTLLLPPSSRRKLQLLMRMMCRISQNVDMPRLHPAIGTRTLMVHTFSGCILGSAVECDLDELLATRLVSFLLDHQERILSVPEYLLSAINNHIQYLRAVQIPVSSEVDHDGGDSVTVPVSIHTFCHQISGAEFEQQKLAASQKAMEELLEMLLTDQNLSERERRKKLKQFQKLYPDIYSRRFPSSEQVNKPKIKPPLLSIKKTKVFSIRN